MANGNIETLYNGTTVAGYKVRWRENGRRPSKMFGPKEKALAERYLTEVRSRSPKRHRRSAPKPLAPTQQPLTLFAFYTASYSPFMHTSCRKGETRSASDLDSKTGIWTKWIQPTLESTFAVDKRYVVQTYTKVIARCLLMTTDPGDLVVDPTCGSGTTAYVAEQYGRRWITMDTSRVAMSIARERVLTATFPYYELRDPVRDVDAGFVYELLDRVTLRSIARGEEPEKVTLVDRPKITGRKVRVSGPFTVEALSRYAINPSDDAPSAGPSVEDAFAHIETLLDALRTLGIPRPGTALQHSRRMPRGRVEFHRLPDLEKSTSQLPEHSYRAGFSTLN